MVTPICEKSLCKFICISSACFLLITVRFDGWEGGEKKGERERSKRRFAIWLIPYYKTSI